MLDTKRQFGVTEETSQQVRPAGELPDFFADSALDFVNSIGSEIREMPIFQIGPELLDRVELGSIGRQPLDLPVCAQLEVSADLMVPMGCSPVPEEHDRTGIILSQASEEV